jgi:hypothetical protein
VCCLALSATASARVLLGESIDGVRIGMTKTQVAAILGKSSPSPGDDAQLLYRHDSYQVIYARSRVESVETFDRGQRTSSGAGTGITLARLKRVQPGVRCQYDGMDGSADCYVGSIKRGHRYTDFFSNNAKTVTGVIVGEGYL